MLNALRRSAGSWVVKALLILLIISFGVWGVGDMLQGRATGTTAIQVGSTTVSVDEVIESFNQELAGFRQAIGQEVDAGMAVRLGLLDRVIGQTVTRMQLDILASELDLAVTDAALREAVRATPVFRDETGAFSRDVMQAILTRQGWSEERFLNTYRNDLRRERLASSMAAAAYAPSALARVHVRHAAQQRRAATVLVPDAAMTVDATPAQEDLEALHQANAARFTVPERRALTVLTMTYADIAESLGFSDEQIADYVKANAGLFGDPEQRRVRQAVFQTEAAAVAALGRIQGGASLEEAAEGGFATDLGWVTADALPSALVDPVFAAPSGEAFGPVQSPLGRHVVIVDDIKPSTVPPLDMVREDAVLRMAEEEGGDALYDLSVQVQDAQASGTPLEGIAERYALSLTSLPPVDREGRTADETKPEALPTDMAVLETAFALLNGETSFIEDMADGYFLVRVDAVDPQSLTPLDAVRGTVEALWKAREQAAKAMITAQELASQATSLTALKDGAKAKGFVLKTHEPVTRDDRETLDAPVLNALFQTREGQSTTVRVAEGVMVVHTDAVIDPDLSMLQTEIGAAQTSLAESMGDAHLQALVQAVEERHPVEIFRDRIMARLP